MTPLEAQIELIKSLYPEAQFRKLPSGAGLITVPSVALPSGWSKAATSVRMLVPLGYPLAKPDCFWADSDLRLRNSGMPQASGFNAIPEVPEPGLWFSWHVAQWNPNRDTLLTYLRVVEDRFKKAQ
jgi:hypothetical protein